MLARENYNPQPYGKNGDTTGFRTLGWYREQVYPVMDHYVMGHGSDMCIDVGCGNGRHFPYLKSRFKTVVGCDPIEVPAEKYSLKYDIFVGRRFAACGWKPGNYQALFFFGSLWGLLTTDGDSLEKTVCKVLSDDGHWHALVDSKFPIKKLRWKSRRLKAYTLTQDKTSYILFGG
jgi:hypothetical protein